MFNLKNFFSFKTEETFETPSTEGKLSHSELVLGSYNPNPEEWAEFWGAHPSLSYAAIIGHPTMRHAINMIASIIACLTANVFIKNDDGRIKEQEHPAFFLLNKAPNDYENAVVLIRQWIAYFLAMGRSAILIIRDSNFQPAELELLDPWNWRSQLDPKTFTPIYMVLTPEGWKDVPPYDLLILRDFGDSLYSYPLIQIARKQMELSHSLIDYALEFFKSGGLTGTADVEFDNKINPELSKKETRDGIEASLKKTGRDRWRTHPHGVKISYNASTNDESQMVQSQENDRKAIASLWGLPANFLNCEINSSYKSLQELRSVRFDALNWILLQMEAEYNRKLLSTADFRTGNRYIELCRDELMELDRQTSQKMLLDLYNSEAISWEEMREKLNLSTTRDEDQHWVHATTVIPDITPQELGLQILSRIKTRLLKSVEAGNIDLSKHRHVVDAQLSAWNNGFVVGNQWMDNLQEELDAVLPEQRPEIINNIDIKELLCKLK